MDADNVIPDITGYATETAERILKESGIETLSIITTSAPLYYQKNNPVSASPSLRVLRQKLLEDGKTVELTVCNF